MSSWRAIFLAAFVSFVATNVLVRIINPDRLRSTISRANWTCAMGACETGACETDAITSWSQTFNSEPSEEQSLFLRVIISPESRVRVLAGKLVPGLVQGEWIEAPISIENQAGVTSSIRFESEQFLDDRLGESRMRWLRVVFVPDSPLTGASLEHRTLRIWSRDQGVRAAVISVNVGQGTQDLGFRSELVQTFLVR